MEHERNSRLHVEDARPKQSAFLNLAWHAGQRPQRINRVVVTEQQNGLAIRRRLARSGKIYLQTVAEVIAAMKTNAPPKGFKPGREECCHAIDCWFVIAWRFDLYELANRFDHAPLMFKEIAEAISPPGPRGSCSVLFCFFTGHDFLSLQGFRLLREMQRGTV